MFLLTLNDKLFLAPIKDPKRAIDIGTGAGIWALYDHCAWACPKLTKLPHSRDFADAFPSTEIIGNMKPHRVRGSSEVDDDTVRDRPLARPTQLRASESPFRD